MREHRVFATSDRVHEVGPPGPSTTSRYSETMKPGDEPLYEIKANLFRALAHPVRIRVLELLVAAQADDPAAEVNVTALLTEIRLSTSALSGHLGVLRNYGVVTARRAGSHVFYRTAHPAVADLLASARHFLLDSLTERGNQLAAAETLPPLS